MLNAGFQDVYLSVVVLNMKTKMSPNSTTMV